MLAFVPLSAAVFRMGVLSGDRIRRDGDRAIATTKRTRGCQVRHQTPLRRNAWPPDTNDPAAKAGGRVTSPGAVIGGPISGLQISRGFGAAHPCLRPDPGGRNLLRNAAQQSLNSKPGCIKVVDTFRKSALRHPSNRIPDSEKCFFAVRCDDDGVELHGPANRGRDYVSVGAC